MTRSPWLRLAAGASIIALILFGQPLFGAATAGSRLDPALQQSATPVNVVVVMDFTPERFHTERLATYGVFGGRDKAVNRIRLRAVSPENLQRLSRIAWVARVEPMH